MKREIKFRGKTRKGEWVYGELVRCVSYASILSREYIEYNPLDRIGDAVLNDLVDEDTIGQYTGLKDKNGNEIYEGDIVVLDNLMWDKQICTCQWTESAARFQLVTNELPFGDTISMYDSETRNMEVIGNIYDNPELLNQDNNGR